MFERAESLLKDIDTLVENQEFPPIGAVLSSSEIGQGVIMLALGRMPVGHSDATVDEKVSARRQQAARQLIAEWFFANDSSFYAVLGTAPDCTPDVLRENYRRLMGLVHPDTRPVGFPVDSASRVNLAYGVLADTDRRASYDASLALLPQQKKAESARRVVPIMPTRPDTPQRGSVLERFRAATPRVRFGTGLLAIAALMLVPIGFALYSLASRDTEVEIVQARPQWNTSPELALRTEKSPDANAILAAPDPVSPSTSASPTNGSRDPALPPLIPPPKLAFSSRLPDMFSGPNAITVPASSTGRQLPNETAALAPVRPTAQQNPVISAELASPLRGTAPVTGVTASDDVSDRTNGATLKSTGSTGALTSATTDRTARAGSPAVAPSPANIVVASPPADARVSHADADDILLKLSSAYESGSIVAFGRVLAPNMVGRRQVLSEYERVFQQTRQRSIRFTQLKHRINGDRLSTSGYAVVSTIDNDNRVSNQRIFLEIDIARESESPKIERLYNYPMN